MDDRLSTGPRDELTRKSEVDASDVLQQIDRITRELKSRPQPSFMQRMFNPVKRGEATNIRDEMAILSEQRQARLREIGGLLTVYAASRRSAAQLASAGELARNFANMETAITQAVEGLYASYFEVAGDTVARLKAVPDLPSDRLEREIEKAWDRAEASAGSATDRNVHRIDELNAQLKTQIERINKIP